MANKGAERRSKRAQAEARREKRVRMVMAVFIVAVMVVSTLGFVMIYWAPAPDNQPQSQFFIRDNLLFTVVDGREVHFYSYPDYNVNVPAQAASTIRDAEAVVILFNASDEQNIDYAEQVRWDLSNYLGKQTGGAIMEPSDEYPFPVLSCDDATSEVPIIRLVSGEQSIEVQDGCVTISGDQEQLLYMRDQFLYEYLRIR